VLHGEFDELSFQTGSRENFIDADEELTFLAVFFRTADVRKGWTKEGLLGDPLDGPEVLICCRKQLINPEFLGWEANQPLRPLF
jgi:hypothetical protein